ncbi:MAG: tyrosine-type recombinase/integrase, partial [Planctomycetota bacterium]|nr:tyrosine-type recombinase/integrase [Planctomycetota bacterium]
MASVFKRKRSKYYQIEYRDETGHKRLVSSHTTEMRAAERLASKLEADVALRVSGVIDPRLEAMAKEGRRPIEEHIDDFLQSKRDVGRASSTIEEAERVMTWLVEATGARTLDDLTSDLLARALRQLRDRGLAVATVNKHLSIVNGFHRWCMKMGRMAFNPAQVLSKQDPSTDRRRERRSLTVDEVERLLVVARERGRAAWYLTALWAGLRRSELLRLTWGDLDLEAGLLTVIRGKAKRVDPLALHPHLVAELSRIKPPLSHPTARVFPREVTNLTRRKDYLRAGIELVDDKGRHADLHAMRTTLATWSAREGIAPQVT